MVDDHPPHTLQALADAIVELQAKRQGGTRERLSVGKLLALAKLGRAEDAELVVASVLAELLQLVDGSIPLEAYAGDEVRKRTRKAANALRGSRSPIRDAVDPQCLPAPASDPDQQLHALIEELAVARTEMERKASALYLREQYLLNCRKQNISPDPSEERRLTKLECAILVGGPPPTTGRHTVDKYKRSHSKFKAYLRSIIPQVVLLWFWRTRQATAAVSLPFQLAGLVFAIVAVALLMQVARACRANFWRESTPLSKPQPEQTVVAVVAQRDLSTTTRTHDVPPAATIAPDTQSESTKSRGQNVPILPQSSSTSNERASEGHDFTEEPVYQEPILHATGYHEINTSSLVTNALDAQLRRVAHLEPMENKWTTDFGHNASTQLGSVTLPDSIRIWDYFGHVRSQVEPEGARTALVLYGGGTKHADGGEFVMILPPVPLTDRYVVLRFDSRVTVPNGILIAAGRYGCPLREWRLMSQRWISAGITLPPCGVRSRVIITLGHLYLHPSSSQVVRLANISLSYWQEQSQQPN